jgi:hypothetical protein
MAATFGVERGFDPASVDKKLYFGDKTCVRVGFRLSFFSGCARALLQPRCDAGLDRSLPHHTARADRLRKSDEFVSLGIAANESTAEEPARTRSHENRTGSRHIA